jgi:MFS family permease
VCVSLTGNDLLGLVMAARRHWLACTLNTRGLSVLHSGVGKALFDDYRGISKEAKYLIIQSILPSLAYGMFFTDLSYFLTTVQGLPDYVMGIIITTMGVSTFISSMLLGIVADKYGRKKLYILGNVIASGIIALFALTANTAILLALATLEGVAEGAFAASSNALIAEKAGDHKRTSIFSLFGFVGNISFGLGSFIIPVVVVFEAFGLSAAESHTMLFLILAALSLGSTLIMLKITESGTLKKSHISLKDLLPRKSRNTLVKFVLTSAIVAFGAGLIVPLMTRWLDRQYGVSDAVSGPILGVANIVIGVATLAAPPLAKRIGLVKAVVVTQGFSTLFMFATPLQPDYLSASFVYTLRSFLMNMAAPLQNSMIMGLVAEDERGAASGVSAAFWRLPNAFSTSIGASLIGLGLLATPFFLAGIFYIISIALFWVFFRRTKMPEEQRNA